ncbi:Ultraviolet-B receptor UVR8 [Diplonema papillatum]|nr:Ultraviolet-B receptor UVR8 [Diplonema papillatum]
MSQQLLRDVDRWVESLDSGVFSNNDTCATQYSSLPSIPCRAPVVVHGLRNKTELNSSCGVTVAKGPDTNGRYSVLLYEQPAPRTRQQAISVRGDNLAHAAQDRRVLLCGLKKAEHLNGELAIVLQRQAQPDAPPVTRIPVLVVRTGAVVSVKPGNMTPPENERHPADEPALGSTAGTSDGGCGGEGKIVQTGSAVSQLPRGDARGSAAVAVRTKALRGYPTVLHWGTMGKSSLGSAPKAVQALVGVRIVDISCGMNHVAVTTSAGEVRCWGDNSVGQCGVLSTEGVDTTKQAVVVACAKQGAQSCEFMTAVACGAAHTLALSAEGSVYAWGANGQGQLGMDHCSDLKGSIVAPAMPGVVSAVACGIGHSIALSTCRLKLFGWGWNNSCQLGLETRGCVALPSDITPRGLSCKITVAACGGGHTVALDEEGNLWCVGSNACGQLGLGHTDNAAQWCKVPSLSGGGVPALVSCGEEFTVVVTQNHEVWTAGLGIVGQLGDGDTTVSQPAFGRIDVHATRPLLELVACSQQEVLALSDEGIPYHWGGLDADEHHPATALRLDVRALAQQRDNTFSDSECGIPGNYRRPQVFRGLAARVAAKSSGGGGGGGGHRLRIFRFVCGRNFYCCVLDGPCPAQCRVEGQRPVHVAGEPALYTVHARDSEGGAWPKGGESLAFAVIRVGDCAQQQQQQPLSASVPAAHDAGAEFPAAAVARLCGGLPVAAVEQVDVDDNFDGTYTVRSRITAASPEACPFNYRWGCVLFGELVATSTLAFPAASQFTVRPASVRPDLCTCEVWSPFAEVDDEGTTVVPAGCSLFVFVTLSDRFGNAVPPRPYPRDAARGAAGWQGGIHGRREGHQLVSFPSLENDSSAHVVPGRDNPAQITHALQFTTLGVKTVPVYYDESDPDGGCEEEGVDADLDMVSGLIRSLRVVVIPGDMDPSTVGLQGEGLTTAEVGMPAFFTVTARDKFGHGVPVDALHLTLFVAPVAETGALSGGVNLAKTLRCVPDADRGAVATWRYVPVLHGSHRLHALDSDGNHVGGSPFSVDVRRSAVVIRREMDDICTEERDDRNALDKEWRLASKQLLARFKQATRRMEEQADVAARELRTKLRADAALQAAAVQTRLQKQQRRAAMKIKRTGGGFSVKYAWADAGHSAPVSVDKKAPSSAPDRGKDLKLAEFGDDECVSK